MSVKLTDLTEVTEIDPGDWFYVVDRSDTSSDPEGSSAKAKASKVLDAFDPGDLAAFFTAS